MISELRKPYQEITVRAQHAFEAANRTALFKQAMSVHADKSFELRLTQAHIRMLINESRVLDGKVTETSEALRLSTARIGLHSFSLRPMRTSGVS